MHLGGSLNAPLCRSVHKQSLVFWNQWRDWSNSLAECPRVHRVCIRNLRNQNGSVRVKRRSQNRPVQVPEKLRNLNGSLHLLFRKFLGVAQKTWKVMKSMSVLLRLNM